MKKIIAGVIVVVVLIGGWKIFFKPAETPAGEVEAKSVVDTFTVRKGDVSLVVEAIGSVEAEQEVEIKCKASGEVTELPFDVSDDVKKGDILAQLDPTDEEIAVKTAEVSLNLAKANMEQAKLTLDIAKRQLKTDLIRAKADLESSQASLDEAKSKFERMEKLFAQKMASQEDLDTAKTTYAQARYNLEDSKATLEDLDTRKLQIKSYDRDVEIAQGRVVTSQLSLDDAKEGYDDTTVKSPLDGVVVAKNVQVGQIISSGTSNVSGGTTIMTIADLTSIYVMVSVDESDIGRIKNGQAARIMVDSYPDIVFPGEVVRVATKGSVSSNIVTFEVKVKVLGSQSNLLKPAMTATVEIMAVEKHDVLVIPAGAIERKNRESYVKISKGGSVEERKVVAGDSDGDLLEIRSGLSEGEVIILPKGGGSRWKTEDNDQEKAQKERDRERHSGPFGGNAKKKTTTKKATAK